MHATQVRRFAHRGVVLQREALDGVVRLQLVHEKRLRLLIALLCARIVRLIHELFPLRDWRCAARRTAGPE